MAKILGIDEAGRGPVIGSMVIVGIIIKEEKEKYVKSLGIKDSKLLSPQKRKYFYKIIKEKIAEDIYLETISADEIDNYCKQKLLNLLEAKYIGKIINNSLNNHDLNKIYIDLPTKKSEKFIEMIKKFIKDKKNIETLDNISLICENKADLNYPVVSCASIIAKVKRDTLIKSLHKKIGDFGSGYPSDIKTLNFLKNYYFINKSFPKEVRRSWKTINNIINNNEFKF